MELINGIHNLRDLHQSCVLTIGKFDGMHLGHQAVLAKVIDKAKSLNLPAAVMVFEPQPEELFSPSTAPARLSTLREKYIELKKLGVQRLFCIRFNRTFANLSAAEFIDELLVKKLNVKFLVVGDDFRFGKNREGDFSALQIAGQSNGFNVVSTQSFRLLDDRISSTAIRGLIANNKFDQAEQMLGRPFSISGKVIHGDKKGRTIGFPTANVLLNRCQSPVLGVFAVKVIVNEKVYNGVANIGSRPTVDGTRIQLEVHIFDYSGYLYGQPLSVEPIRKIREELRFASFEELRNQIELDVKDARRVFEQEN